MEHLVQQGKHSRNLEISQSISLSDLKLYSEKPDKCSRKQRVPEPAYHYQKVMLRIS